ncbi:alpha/beta-hydrolase [Microthyrium microscopicum]|uniref:Carboxylic ester hydrolase n=1 Tax=Microthyrium microscopicum TaxID=703497 RepID=A0A6A6UAJ7_9PEZI|nr:alpha/beta-hydrolase [Microthyrium microscopicum]
MIPGGIGGGLDLGSLINGLSGSAEDCLFVDVFVPGKALKSGAKLPVVNWIYGGAYVLGEKSGMYGGTPIVKAANGNLIYVSGNYRLGVLGFLAGTTMEKEGAPNAGLWDQRLLMEWIQKYIGLFGGDANEVSVWGESAGAGSIIHHLTAFGGKNGPALFKRAIIMSPAYDQQLDRKGQLEKGYQDIARRAGCGGKNVDCLRKVSLTTVMKAASDWTGTVPGDKPGFGPAADGVFVRQIPSLEFAAGNFAKNVESVILSHTANEGLMFVPRTVTPTSFSDTIKFYWGASPKTVAAIEAQFPLSKFKDEKDRFRLLYQWSTFACSARYGAEAYKGKAYNMQYSVGTGLHGSDLNALFNQGGLASLFNPSLAALSPKYRNYFVSHALTKGDPNKLKSLATPSWPLVTIAPSLSGVLNVTDTDFKLIEDPEITAADCGFWTKVLGEATKELGYSPSSSASQVHS